MTDIWFYHLQKHPLDRVLPTLVERVLERGWNAVIQSAQEERLAAIDDLLWTYKDESFSPHGSSKEGDAEMQRVWLTAQDDNPNNAAVRFFIDGADAAAVLDKQESAPSERVILLFDGRDEEAVAAARSQFRILRDKGHSLSYWRQNDAGRWEKIA